MITAFRPGNFASVAGFEDWIYVAAKDNASGEMVVSRLDGQQFTETARLPCGSAGAGFPSLKSAQGALWLGYIPADGQSARVVNLTTGAPRQYDGRCETWGIVLGVNGYAINFNGGNGPTQTFRYDGSLVATLDGVGAPTGLARVADDLQSVVTTDQNRDAEKEWGIFNPDYAGDVFTGEGNTGGIPLVYKRETKIIEFNGNPYCFLPKVAQLGNTWAAVSSDYNTVTCVAEITAADFGGVQPPDPPDPPQPPNTVTLTISGPLAAGTYTLKAI